MCATENVLMAMQALERYTKALMTDEAQLTEGTRQYSAAAQEPKELVESRAQDTASARTTASSRTRLMSPSSRLPLGPPRTELAQRTGISAHTRVPAEAGLSSPSRPSRASTRSASPRRPEPREGSAPPIPSSTTSTRAAPLARLIRTSTVEAFATWRCSSATRPRRSSRGLDVRRQPRGEVVGDRDRQSGPVGQNFQSGAEPALGQDRGVDPTCEDAQVVDRVRQLLRDGGE